MQETGELRAALQEAAAAQKAAEARAHEAEAQAQDLVGQLGSHKGTVESLMLANAELASRVNIQVCAPMAHVHDGVLVLLVSLPAACTRQACGVGRGWLGCGDEHCDEGKCSCTPCLPGWGSEFGGV